MSQVVAFVLKGYPRLSETFIAQEIHALERRGLDIRLFSMRRPTDPHHHPVHSEIKAPVNYLPEYLYQEPRRVWNAWRALRQTSGYQKAWQCWWADFKRDVTPNRIRRFGQALVLAHELPLGITWVHAHFLHTPASVARYAATIRSLPWSCSAHAKDIWTLPDWEKAEKLSDMRWLVTCTKANVEHLSALSADQTRIELVYHGLDFARFPSNGRDHSSRDGGDGSDPVVIVSVGRAVEKKGYGDLLNALSNLPAGLSWKFIHIGGGELLRVLQKQARDFGIDDRIEWLGAQPHETVLETYGRADLFVLASRIAANGDRDGLPNVLMEAQSQGVACVSTNVSAVPELVVDGETGVLVAPGDTSALTQELENLITHPALRRTYGEAGRQRVHSEFTCETGIDRLASRFGLLAEEAEACESHSMPQ